MIPPFDPPPVNRPQTPLFDRLVDDAGLFPPTSLTMEAALARHHEARAADPPVLTHRFLCPASRLEELRSELRAELSRPIAIGLILDTGDPAAVSRALVDPLLAVALVEVPPGGPVEELPSGVPAYLEVARGDLETIERIAARPGLGAKVRCGGVRADLFPTVEELGAFIRACVAADLPFKATAGLHHAVRYTDPETGFTHHGFLNLLLAVAAALSEGDVEEVLASTDAAALADTANAMDHDAARAVRRLLVAYGSCSISTPLQDLFELGLVKERA